MGSAAPSLRRWLPLSLLVLVGVSTAALVIGLVQGMRAPLAASDPPGSEPTVDSGPSLGSEPVVTSGSFGGAETRTITVALEPGWEVPAIDDESVTLSDGSHLTVHKHDDSVEVLEPGSLSVGGRLTVGSERTMVLIHGATPRRLAYRVGTAADTDPDTGSGSGSGSGTGTDGAAEWQMLSITQDEGPDALPGEEGHDARAMGAGPLFIDQGKAYIDFVVIGGDTSSFEVTLLAADMSRFERSEGSEEPIPAPAGAAVGQVGEPFAQPSIIPRDQWADQSWNYQREACDGGPSVATHTQAVVVHHTVTGNDYSEADVDDLLRAIYYSHVVVNGWCDIGYNFVVDRFGRIWEARTGSIDASVIGGHSRGFNTGTVGVALLGQHQSGASPSAVNVSSQAESAVAALAHWKLGIHGVDPAGKTWLRNRSSTLPSRLTVQQWHYVPTILGHRDLGITSCPGSRAISLVDDLPATLAADRDLSLPYSFVDWQAHSHGPGFAVAESGGGIRPAGAATPWSQAPTGLSGGSAVIAVGGSLTGGYLLSADGTLNGFGSAPAIADKPAGAAIAVDLVVRSDGQSGWVLDDQGLLHGFGGTGDSGADTAVTEPVAAAVDDDGLGYVLSAAGALHTVGGSAPAQIDGSVGSGSSAVDLDLRPDGGGWVLDSAGWIHGFGGAPSDRVQPPAAVRAIGAASAGPGGWVLDAEGQLWPFEGARLIFPVSTNASAGNAVDFDNVGSVYSPAFINSGDARFVSAIHQLFLGREPSTVEIDLDVTALEQGARRSGLTETMARSEYWSGASIDEMYRNALGREPDAEGRGYWLTEIGNGLQLQDLGTYFYGSAEYAAAAGGTEAYVAGLYNVLLQRAPDLDGLEYWTELLDTGQATPPDVAHGFYASIESRRDRAAALYRRILGDEPNDEDRQYWAERLLSAGDAGVAAELAASSDYYRLVVEGPEP